LRYVVGTIILCTIMSINVYYIHYNVVIYQSKIVKYQSHPNDYYDIHF